MADFPDSRILLIHSASNHWPVQASFWSLAIFLLVGCCVGIASVGGQDSPESDSSKDAAKEGVASDQFTTSRGALVICGGGSIPDAARDRFVELAGGPQAKLVVIPTASARADEDNVDSLLQPWKQAGIANVKLLHTRDRSVADSPEFNEPLREATAVWFSGGQQSRLAATYVGTLTERLVGELYQRGGVVGGTSAGAAIQSRIMIQSGNPEPEISLGFDLLPHAIIDQHFLRRNRFNRLLSAVAQHPRRIGVGISESTALVYQQGQGTVLGEAYVTTIQSTGRTPAVAINSYRDGQTIDLARLPLDVADNRLPVHRYSFHGHGGTGTLLVDSLGNLPGRIQSPPQPAELPFHEGSTTLVVIPDTEGYCRKRPEVFYSMMQWVADERVKRNIKYLLHVGDITNDNAEVEWIHARKAFDRLEGKIPYVLAAGNHDYDNTPGRLTYLNDHFPVAEQKKWPGFGDVMEPGHLENHYQFLRINGQKWIVLSLEMGPRKKVVEWANSVLKKHPDHLAIVLTHGYLYYDNQRYDHRQGNQRATPHNFYGEGADGEMLWQQLVSRHPNVMLVVCGHVSSQYVGYRQDRTAAGNVVHQMLVDYEKLKGGGQGFLRLLEFLPDGKRVQVRTYSPVTGEIRSPITQGESPLREPALEEFLFELQVADGQHKLLETHPSTDQQPADTSKAESDLSGPESTSPPNARLNGQGQLVIPAEPSGGFAKLDAKLVRGRRRVSLEVWFTPTAEQYNWAPVVQFQGGQDFFYYKFRTLTTHRAELIDDGHNEDIQKRLEVQVGQPLHVVMTYDEEGPSGKPELRSYVNGQPTGRMNTAIRLSQLELTAGQIGPFAGKFDELRVYDYVLPTDQVARNFKAGPDRLDFRATSTTN